jgi:hypothetical protein
MPSMGFEHAIPEIKLLQTHALDRTATGMGYTHTHARTHARTRARAHVAVFFRLS